MQGWQLKQRGFQLEQQDQNEIILNDVIEHASHTTWAEQCKNNDEQHAKVWTEIMSKASQTVSKSLQMKN